MGGLLPFMVITSTCLGDMHLVGPAAGAECMPSYVYASDNSRHDNITDWALNQFGAHYPDAGMDKRDIFDYVYAVLHNPAGLSGEIRAKP